MADMRNPPAGAAPAHRADLASARRAGRSRPRSTGVPRAPAARGPVIGTLVGCQPAQRDRRPCRRLRALSRAGGRRRQPERAASARSDQYRAGRADRAASAVGRSEPRSSRSIPTATSSARRSPSSSPQGWDIRPTIAVTKARLTVPELKHAVRLEQVEPDGRVVTATGEVNCTKVAIEPVWYLPGVAERCGVSESDLRRHLFEQTGGMFPELVTRPTCKVFLPPIGGQTVYIFGDLADARPIRRARSPAACTTNATARTCSAPTSAPAGRIWCTASRSASRPRRPAASG